MISAMTAMVAAIMIAAVESTVISGPLCVSGAGVGSAGGAGSGLGAGSGSGSGSDVGVSEGSVSEIFPASLRDDLISK